MLGAIIASCAGRGPLLVTSGTAGTLGANVGWSLLFGSIGNATLRDGKALLSWADNAGVCSIQIGGFSSDPGQGYAVSFRIGLALHLAASATYSYDSGTGIALWQFSAMGFANGVGFDAAIV